MRNFSEYQGIRYKRKRTNPPPPQNSETLQNVSHSSYKSVALVELSRDEMSSSRVEAQAQEPLQPPPVTEPAKNDDNLLAYFWKKLENISGLIGSHQAELYQDMVRDIETIPIAQQRPFVDSLFAEAATNTTGRVRPSWYRAVIDSALREGRLPGEKRDAPAVPPPRMELVTEQWRNPFTGEMESHKVGKAVASGNS